MRQFSVLSFLDRDCELQNNVFFSLKLLTMENLKLYVNFRTAMPGRKIDYINISTVIWVA
jgi:hypothetical protein